MNRDRLIGILLIEAIFYTAIWLINDYMGLILSLSIALVAFAIMLISWIADRLEYAGVGPWYYPLMIGSVIIPLLVAFIFWKLKSGEMDWMQPIF